MSEVFSRFAHLWENAKPQRASVVQSDDDIRLEHERRMVMVHDVRAFISTQAYKDYREWIQHEIELSSPDPRQGSDVAACFTFKREGLMVALRRLDTMVKLAEERLEENAI